MNNYCGSVYKTSLYYFTPLLNSLLQATGGNAWNEHLFLLKAKLIIHLCIPSKKCLFFACLKHS